MFESSMADFSKFPRARLVLLYIDPPLARAVDVQQAIRQRLNNTPENEYYCSLFDACGEAAGLRTEA